jgi:tripartite-type tricarboxylate transporter receptor subunit TctC
VQDVLSNQLPVMVIDTAVGLPHIPSGKLVPLGVLSRKRLAALPNVPTLEEQGIRDTEVYAWQGVVVPAATPRDVASKLTAELNRAIATPEVTRKLQEFGLEPIPGNVEQMTAYIKSETARWHALIKQRRLTLE